MTDDELANACPQIGKTRLERNKKAPDGLLMITCSGLLKYISALEPKQHFIINVLKHMGEMEGGERKGGREKKERVQKGGRQGGKVGERERESRRGRRKGGR